VLPMPLEGASSCRRSCLVGTSGRLLSSNIPRAPVHGPGPVHVHGGRAGLRPSLAGRRCERARWTSRASTRSRSTRRCVHAGPDRVRPAGCRLGLGPARRVVDQLAERFPAAAELLAGAAADLLTFTAFPAETGARPGPTIPGALNSELAERVYRLEVCSCSRITSGPGSSRFPLWPSVTTSQDQHSTTARHARNRLFKLPFGFGICPFHQAGVHYRHRVELSNS
jgi:hypothetical protein